MPLKMNKPRKEDDETHVDPWSPNDILWGFKAYCVKHLIFCDYTLHL